MTKQVYNLVMNILIETHSHTVASGHFTHDTITDLARAAKQKGLRLLCVTDHSPSIPGSATENYFRSLKYCEKKRFGVELLYGTEADVMDEHGKLGMSDEILAEMGIVIASQHPPCFKPSDIDTNTRGMIHAVESGCIDIVGHPDDEKYPLDAETLVNTCKQYGTMIEMNNASLNPNGYRGDAKARDAELLKLCKEKRVYVSLGSDSHGAAHIADFTYALALVRECNFPEELIVNSSLTLFRSLLAPHSLVRKKYLSESSNQHKLF